MTKTINIMNAKILISMCFMLFLNIALANTSARKQIRLQRRDIPINRELVMDPEAWYDTEEHIIDVTMHSNRNRGCTTGITKSLFVKSINSDYLYVEFKNLRLWQEVDLYQF